jgi:hypothetical protein
MNESCITKLTGEIRSKYDRLIQKLKDEEEKALAGLADIMASFNARFPAEDEAGSVEPPSQTQQTEDDAPSAASRVKLALESQNGEFSSTKLWDAANRDGNGPPITRAAFSTCLANLIKGKQVVVVRKHTGNTGGTYRKP